MTRALALLVVTGCGRIAFAPLDDAGVASADTIDSSNASGLLLWLPFDDAISDGTADDASGASAHATCFTNCPTTIVDGRYGNAMSFDSMGQALSALPVVPQSNFTWTVWIRLAANQPFSGILSMHGESGLRPGGAEIGLLSGEVTVWANGDAHGTAMNLTLDTWAHVALVREAGLIRTYIDGALADTSADADPHEFLGCELFIGVDADVGCTGGLNGYYEGDLDEVRIYARPLTTIEVAADLASATPVPPP